MKCSNCGADMSDSALFCSSCGAKATQPAATCRQCQTSLKPEALFCPNCGSKVQGATPAATQPAIPFAPPRPANQLPYAQPMAPAKPRRKGKGLFVALAILLVLVIAGGSLYALFGSAALNSIKQLVIGPKATYLSIEGKALKQNAADLVADLAEYGNKNAQQIKGGYNLGLQFDINETAFGVDAATAAALENITINSKTFYDRSGMKPKLYSQMDFLAADEKLLTMNYYYDQEQMIVSVPDILKKSIVATAEELADNMGASESTASLTMLSSLLNADLGIDEAKLKGTFNRMVDSLLDHIDKTEFQAGQTLKAGDVTAKYDLYTSTIQKESARKLLLEIFKDLRDDKEFYNLASKIAGYSAMSSGISADDALTFADYQASIDELIADLEADDSSEDFTIVQKVYVGKDNEVFGRELTIKSASGANQLHYLYAHPVNGSKEALTIQFEAEETAFTVNSAYTLIDSKKTGTATIIADSKEVVAASFKDLYTKTVGAEDRLLGTLKLTFKNTPSTGTTVPTPTGFNFTGKEDKSIYKMEIEIPDMIGLTIAYSNVAAADITFPTYAANNLVSVSNTEALNSLMTPEVQQKFMAIVQKMGLMPAGG